ncbi:hypothetical protein SAMN04488688_10637 [Paenibacillus sp. cl141a]|nr:hypothetical protein SAMN04488688_10637 [Paenibacillus sp. cl141a]
MVVGGYGHVGSMICRELGEKYPGFVYATGRSLERAERFSRETGGNVLPMRLDLDQPVMECEWERIKLVVMCLDHLGSGLPPERDALCGYIGKGRISVSSGEVAEDS